MYAISSFLSYINGCKITIPQLSAKSMEEWVNRLIENPEELDSLLQFIQEDNADISAKCNEFINSLLEEYKKNSFVISYCAQEFICKLPKHILLKFLEEYPLVLTDLTYLLEDWKNVFLSIFQSLDKSKTDPNCTLQQTQAGKFLFLLSNHLSNRRTKQWIKFFAKNLKGEDWLFFISSLDKVPRRYALNIYICFCTLDLTQQGLAPCIEGLVQCLDYPDLVVALNQILHKFYRQQAFDLMINQIEQLTLRAQVRLLDAMSSPKQELMLNHYQDNLFLMASWMDELFHYRSSFIHRTYYVKEILKKVLKIEKKEVEEGKLEEFLSCLSSRGSSIGPYLLICLSGDDFDDFIYSIPCPLRSDLLCGGVADSNTWKLLQTIKKKIKDREGYFFKCNSMTLNMENPKIPVDPLHPLTLEECFNTLQTVVKDKEIIENYDAFIMRIPPILIGILALDSYKRETLFKLVNFFTEEQIKFFILSFPSQALCQTIESLKFSLRGDQLTAILEILSIDQLKAYVNFKTEDLNKSYQEFLNHYEKLQRDLEKIKEGNLITFATYSELEKQKTFLYRLIYRSKSFDYHYLLRFLNHSSSNQKVPQNIVDELKQVIDNFNNKRPLFEGPHALMTIKFKQLEESISDQEMEEEEDLRRTLYLGFWLLMRKEVLPYLGISEHSSLGITDAGQLTLFGIRTDNDLDYLGISKQVQKNLDDLIQQVELLLEQSAESLGTEEKKRKQEDLKQPFLNQWQRFIDISDDKRKPTCQELIQMLNLQMNNHQKVKKVCLHLCQGLIQFKHLQANDRVTLMQGIQELEKCWELEKIFVISESLLREVFLLLREQYPLFCLKRYLLENVNLKQTWEKLRSLGFHSISQLIENRHMQVLDLLRLEEIAAKM